MSLILEVKYLDAYDSISYMSFLQNVQKRVGVMVFIASVGLLVYLPLWIVSIQIYHTQIQNFPASRAVALPVLGNDSSDYKTLADNLRIHHCFSLSSSCDAVETFRVPGYPFFIALLQEIFGSPFAVTFVQCLLSLLTGFFIYKLSRLYFSLRYSVYVMLAFLIEPSVVLYSLTLLSDIPFTFLIVFSVYLFLKEKPTLLTMFCIGLIIGISAFFRPISLYILPLYLICYFFIYSQTLKNFFKGVAISIFGFCLVIVPWMIHNDAKVHIFTFSTITSYLFFHYNIPIFLASQSGQSLSTVETQLAQQVGLSQSDMFKPENNTKLIAIDEHIILQQPFAYSYFHLVKTIPFFLSSSVENAQTSYYAVFSAPNVYTHKPIFSNYILQGDMFGFIQAVISTGPVFLESIIWLFITILAFLSVIYKKDRRVKIFFVLLVLYFAIVTGPVSSPRYRVPVEPFLFVLTAMTLATFFEKNVPV